MAPWVDNVCFLSWQYYISSWANKNDDLADKQLLRHYEVTISTSGEVLCDYMMVSGIGLERKGKKVELPFLGHFATGLLGRKVHQ